MMCCVGGSDDWWAMAHGVVSQSSGLVSPLGIFGAVAPIKAERQRVVRKALVWPFGGGLGWENHLAALSLWFVWKGVSGEPCILQPISWFWCLGSKGKLASHRALMGLIRGILYDLIGWRGTMVDWVQIRSHLIGISRINLQKRIQESNPTWMMRSMGSGWLDYERVNASLSGSPIGVGGQCDDWMMVLARVLTTPLISDRLKDSLSGVFKLITTLVIWWSWRPKGQCLTHLDSSARVTAFLQATGPTPLSVFCTPRLWYWRVVWWLYDGCTVPPLPPSLTLFWLAKPRLDAKTPCSLLWVGTKTEKGLGSGSFFWLRRVVSSCCGCVFCMGREGGERKASEMSRITYTCLLPTPKFPYLLLLLLLLFFLLCLSLPKRYQRSKDAQDEPLLMDSISSCKQLLGVCLPLPAIIALQRNSNNTPSWATILFWFFFY